MALDLGEYRREAEEFCARIERRYYLHLAGHEPELELEPVYERHRGLFSRPAVNELRERAGRASGEEGRRLRYLLHFAVDGLLGEAMRPEAEETARLEAALEVAAGGDAIPYRRVQVEQANEPAAERRRALEEARNALLAERLTPLHRAALERAHAICRELGWASYADAYAELRGIDLAALARGCRRFLAATADAYEGALGRVTGPAGVPPLGELRRADLPRLFRAADLDAGFAAERLLPSLAETLGALGIDLASQANVRLDTASRPTKSPRAFCSTPRVPDEVYLVVSPVGGREDFAALYHEAGHAEHYANTDSGLAFEFRQLGDNAVTESFAFLVEHLTEEPAWLAARLGGLDPEPLIAHATAARLLLLRRYCAKLCYELELHGPAPRLGRLPERYSELLSAATGIPWPHEPWLADVDGGFYAACYLRAWALEPRWRAALRERFGELWFQRAEAGEWLRRLWSQGQRLGAEELLAETLGEELEFASLATELAGSAVSAR